MSSPTKSHPSHIILTTYPDQVGIRPIAIEWGASSPEKRGPVVVSRMPGTIKLRNALGAHGGSYSVPTQSIK